MNNINGESSSLKFIQEAARTTKETVSSSEGLFTLSRLALRTIAVLGGFFPSVHLGNLSTSSGFSETNTIIGLFLSPKAFYTLINYKEKNWKELSAAVCRFSAGAISVLNYLKKMKVLRLSASLVLPQASLFFIGNIFDGINTAVNLPKVKGVLKVTTQVERLWQLNQKIQDSQAKDKDSYLKEYQVLFSQVKVLKEQAQYNPKEKVGSKEISKAEKVTKLFTYLSKEMQESLRFLPENPDQEEGIEGLSEGQKIELDKEKFKNYKQEKRLFEQRKWSQWHKKAVVEHKKHWLGLASSIAEFVIGGLGILSMFGVMVVCPQAMLIFSLAVAVFSLGKVLYHSYYSRDHEMNKLIIKPPCLVALEFNP